MLEVLSIDSRVALNEAMSCCFINRFHTKFYSDPERMQHYVDFGSNTDQPHDIIKYITNPNKLYRIVSGIDQAVFNDVKLLYVPLTACMFIMICKKHDKWSQTWPTVAKQFIQEFADMQSVLLSDDPCSDENVNKIKVFFHKYGYEHTDKEIRNRLFVLSRIDIL